MRDGFSLSGLRLQALGLSIAQFWSCRGELLHGGGFTGHIDGLLLLFGWVIIIFCKGDIVHIPRQFRYG